MGLQIKDGKKYKDLKGVEHDNAYLKVTQVGFDSLYKNIKITYMIWANKNVRDATDINNPAGNSQTAKPLFAQVILIAAGTLPNSSSVNEGDAECFENCFHIPNTNGDNNFASVYDFLVTQKPVKTSAGHPGFTGEIAGVSYTNSWDDWEEA